MTIGELMQEFMARKWRNCSNKAEATILAGDYRAAGLQDGIPLAEAWQRCRAEWTKQTAPRPPDFRMYLPAPPGRANATNKGLRNLADMVKRAPTPGAVSKSTLESIKKNLDEFVRHDLCTYEQTERWRDYD